MECLACSRIQEIKENMNPYFVCETETGYVVIGDFQLFLWIYRFYLQSLRSGAS